MCFFWTPAFFSLPAADLFSCSRLRNTQGARPNTTAQVWALAAVRGMCSGGSKSQVTTGRDSEHVEPSRPMHTHVQVTKIPDGLRMSFRILLTARTCARMLVAVLSCSCSCSTAPRRRVRVLSSSCLCSSTRYSARLR